MKVIREKVFVKGVYPGRSLNSQTGERYANADLVFPTIGKVLDKILAAGRISVS